MPQFNEQQLEAIVSLNENVVVSASAGAGKTTVLIERLMKRILKDGVSIDRICALTFTDAAANEMKKRLLAALSHENTVNPSDYLNTQMMLVETAHISTIHSFCLSLIKDHGYILGISEDRTQNILDPAMVTLYQKQAMADTLDSWANNQPEQLRVLLETFTTKPQNTQAFEVCIQSVAKFINSKHDADTALQAIRHTYAATTFLELPLVVQEAYFQTHHLHLTLVIEALQSVIQTLDLIEDQEEQTTVLLTHLEMLIHIKKQVEAYDISFVDAVESALDIRLKTLRNQPEYKDAGDQLALVIGDYIPTVEPIAKSLALLNQQAPLLDLVLTFTQDYLNTFTQIKEHVGGLDFDDFEHLAYSLLVANNGLLSSELKTQFDEIMVDEFQDTNDFQDAIIQLISNGHNIFRVGDVKQSIYRFRGAKPSIMQALIADESIRNIYLSYNYRSKADIVFFNNDFFDRILNLTQGMTYSNYDHVDIGTPKQQENTEPVEFLVVTDPKEPVNNAYTIPWDSSRNMRKARVIAQQVIRHHHMGYRFRDIVILIRGHAQKVFLKRAFQEVNIPHFIDDRGGFYQSSIVSSLLSFFEYALDRTDYSLARVLLSPFMRFSPDDLAALKLISPTSLRKGLEHHNREAYNQIHDLLSLWKTQDIVSCILDVINLNDTYHTMLSIQDKTNLDALLEKAITYQSSNNPTLLGFMDFVHNLDDTKSAEAIPLSDNDDVVTAMTIHQSKGLQFPVVIMWSMGRRTNRDLLGPLVIDDALGVALNDKLEPFNVSRPSILRALMQTKQDGEDLEETLRLVYVAMTRPQERLVIVDVLKEFKEVPLNHQLIYSYKQMIDLLVTPHSVHRTLTVESYDSLPYTVLQPLEPQTTQTSFTPLLLEETIAEEIYHGAFEFNPNFFEATQYGLTLHEAVERLPQRSWSLEDLKAYEAIYHPPLTTYNQHPFTQKLYTAINIEVEMPFILEEDTTIRNGIIDAYYVFDDTIIIVDYKTDNATMETLRSRYTQQLATYRKAISTAYPSHTIHTYIYSFHNHDYLELS